MQTKSKMIAVIGAVLIVAIMLFTPWGSNIFPSGTGEYQIPFAIDTKTSLKSFSSSGASGTISIDTLDASHPGTYLKVENKLNYRDLGEIFDSDRYIVSWQPGEYSKAITARVDASFKTRYDQLWSFMYGLGSFPTTYIKNTYWWEVTYTEPSNTIGVPGKSIRIIDGKNFTGGPIGQPNNDASVKKDYVSLIQGYPRNSFPNTVIQEQDVPTANGETGWWAPSNAPSATETVNLQTEVLVFEMKGNRVGTLNIKCYLLDSQYATRDMDWLPIPIVGGMCKVRVFTKTGPVLLCEDNAYLPSGLGSVTMDGLNAIKSVGSENAGGTGIIYTKYVWAEGQNVTFNVKTGYSGTAIESDQEGYKEGWYLKISNSKGQIARTGNISRYIKGVLTKTNLNTVAGGLIPLDDGLTNYKIQYQIPTGAFIANDPNDNEWMVTLSNTMFDQSETRLFVVDSLLKLPGQSKAIFDKDHYKQWETVKLTLSAMPNPAGANDVNHFRVWVNYDGWTSTNYALTARSVPAVKTGSGYTATVSFQVALGDKNLYATTVAIDSQGRAGPEGEDIAYVEQVIPNPNPNPFPVIPGGDTLWLIVALIGIAVAGGIFTYFMLKKKKGGSKPSFKKPNFKMPKWGKKK